MAKKATHESEEQDAAIQAQPDFEQALKIMANDVHPASDKSASARGNLSAAWKAIEKDCHVNKRAAKLYFQLAGESEEIKDDFLRSFYGLMKAGGMGISADLVDRMEGDGEAPEMPIAATKDRGGLATLNQEARH